MVLLEGERVQQGEARVDDHVLEFSCLVMSPTLGQTGQADTGSLDDPLDFLLLQVREVFPQSLHQLFV